MLVNFFLDGVRRQLTSPCLSQWRILMMWSVLRTGWIVGRWLDHISRHSAIMSHILGWLDREMLWRCTDSLLGTTYAWWDVERTLDGYMTASVHRFLVAHWTRVKLSFRCMTRHGRGVGRWIGWELTCFKSTTYRQKTIKSLSILRKLTCDVRSIRRALNSCWWAVIRTNESVLVARAASRSTAN